MAYQNKTIVNPQTGQTIRFIQTARDTGGRLLEMESTLRAHSKEPPAHYHPNQEEKFKIISGELTVKINGTIRVCKAGDGFDLPRKTVHSMWNQSSEPVLVNWQVIPALNTEEFFETTMGLAIDGKTNSEGMPNILQVSLIANKYDQVFRLASPPFIFQKIAFSILAPIAYLAGLRPTYDHYLNEAPPVKHDNAKADNSDSYSVGKNQEIGR